MGEQMSVLGVPFANMCVPMDDFWSFQERGAQDMEGSRREYYLKGNCNPFSTKRYLHLMQWQPEKFNRRDYLVTKSIL